MPYKKGSLAEQAGKVRRTAKRRIARLEKEINKSNSDSERLFYRQQIDVLRDQISKTYQRNPQSNLATGFDKDSILIAVQNLSRTNTSSLIGTSNVARSNFLTTQELNRAEYHDFIGPTQSSFTREEVSIFYRATQRAWEGLPSTADRNKAILEYYGETNLNKFVREVLSKNMTAVELSERYQSSLYRTPEDITDAEARENRMPSPTFLSYVIPIEDYDSMKDFIVEARRNLGLDDE